MKKFGTILIAMGLSASAFAWEFTEISVSERSFEFRNNYGATYVVSYVECMATDGRDALYVEGYFAPYGKWYSIGKQISGKNIRNKMRRIDESLLPAYMDFCARVNRYYGN